MSERNLPAWAREYVGIPFSEEGETPEEGLNCWMLARYIINKETGILLPSYREHYKDSHDHEHVAQAMKEALIYWTQQEKEWIQHEDPGEMDILFFRKAGDYLHCGIALNHLYMLHTLEGEYASITRYRKHPIWSPVFLGAYRHISRITKGCDMPSPIL